MKTKAPTKKVVNTGAYSRRRQEQVKGEKARVKAIRNRRNLGLPERVKNKTKL